MRKDFLVFGAPRIAEDEIAEVVQCLQTGWIGTGPRVAEFEERFARYKGASHAIAVNSCTAALHLSILAADIGPGDEVITTPMTFCATVNAIIHAGATPVLADIDPQTMNIDPCCVREKITPRTKAVLPVHFAGRSCDMDALCSLCAEHGLILVEDCAHAVETEFHGRKAGTFGAFGCLSFYVTKNIITGEGGMILAKDSEHAARLKVLALHGMSSDAWKRFGDEGYKHYLVTEAGFKYNMMDMQAALGLRQLDKVEDYWRRREEIWQRYMHEFADLPLTLPAPVEPDTRHGYHLFSVRVNEKNTGISRDTFLTRMTEQKIGVGVHYLSLPEHPYYQQQFGWNSSAYPHAESLGRETVSLPLSARLTDDDVEDVITAVRFALG